MRYRWLIASPAIFLMFLVVPVKAQRVISVAIKWTAEDLISQIQYNYQKRRALKVRFTLEDEVRRERNGVVTTSISSYDVTQILDQRSRSRIEVRGESFDITRVIDGRLAWHYLPDYGIYTRSEADDRGFHKKPEGDERYYTQSLISATEVLNSYTSLMDPGNLAPGQSLRLVGEEEVVIGERRFKCFLVEFRMAGNGKGEMDLRLWIDPEYLMIRREERVLRSQVTDGRITTRIRRCLFREIVVDQPVDPENFFFTPPAEAILSPRLNPIERQNSATVRIGSMARDFTLRDLGGKVVSLKSLRGRVVLINFWATWCGPCRIEMPHLEKLYREYGQKGVAFLTISTEEQDVISQFLKAQSYSFGSLVDEKGEVSRLYGVSGIPHTLLIDRSGRVVDQMRGARKESDFRAAISKGLNSTAPVAANGEASEEDRKPVVNSCLPVLVSPAAGALLGNTANGNGVQWSFKWTGCPDISRYHLQIIAPGVSAPWLESDGVLALSYHYRRQKKLAPEMALKGWRWRLRGQARNKWGEWVEGRFDVEPVREVVETGLMAPVQLSPGDRQFFDLQPRLTEVTWRPVLGARFYRVELDLYQNGSWQSETPGKQSQLIDVQVTSASLSFGSSQLGRWRVRAIGEDGREGTPSGWWECRFLK